MYLVVNLLIKLSKLQSTQGLTFFNQTKQSEI